jgi:hypothetical protein
MERSELDFEGPMDEPQHDLTLPDSPEERIDRFGVMTALFVLCVAFFIAAIWFLNRPSFEKCSTLESAAERNGCYDKLRNDLSQPPAKGADVPKG